MRLLLCLILISLVTASIILIRPVKAEEPTLVDILAQLGFTNIMEVSNQTFMSEGTYSITLYAEFTDYHAYNNLSWYLVGTSECYLIFNGSEGNYGYINPSNKIFAANGEFGVSFCSPEGRYYTETSKNDDGIKHAMIYINLDDPDMYLIGFENKHGTGDEDYNDMVISLKLISQSVSLAGINWYIANTTSDKVMIYLDGGLGIEAWVYVKGWDSDKTTEEANFLSKMVSGGFDVIFNKDLFGYCGNETIVKDTATWLLNNGYKRVFLFGWSAGGVVVAYEIQKEYASTVYSTAVVSSAPVNWDSVSNDTIFQSAHTADRDKVATCFIEGEGDPYYGQMLFYYNNTIVDKKWHTWNDGHNIFLNTCKEHPGEDVATATINWFNTPHLIFKVLTFRTQETGGWQIVGIGVTINDQRYESPVVMEVYGGTYTVTVDREYYRPYSKFTFQYCDNGNTNPTRTVNVNDDTTIIAYYTEEVYGGCPTLYVWNGTSYAEEGILDIHAESDVTIQHEIQNSLALENGVYKLQLRELDNFTSHIDQVKLYAVDNEGKWHLCPLAYAYHSELGKVTLKLVFDDGKRVDLEPTETIDLKFLPSIAYHETAYFILEINGYNSKPIPR